MKPFSASFKSGRILMIACCITAAQASWGAPRYRPANPRGAADPRGAYDPRGVADPRGAYDPRGVADPRGPHDPRHATGYVYTLPANYTVRAYGGVTYYHSAGTFYYVYYINGRPVYVKAPVVNGVPTVPPAPY